MITAYIVEDETPARQRLREFLRDIPDIKTVGESGSGKQAVLEIDRLQPDLLFLDIHLPDISGIDVLHLLNHRPEVIFTTAYDQYAIKAFELQATDYLLKPFSRERFLESVQRVREKMSDGSRTTAKQRDPLPFPESGQPHLRRIASRVGDKIYLLPDDDIVYFSSENKLVFACLEESKYILNYTLEQLEERLDSEKFFRIHRATIVNLNYVHKIEAWFGGGYKMTVRDKKHSELTISRSAAKALREKLGW